ncbi:MAG: hypothetical protein AAGM38_17055 [Pseudomonadota bacterium]
MEETTRFAASAFAMMAIFGAGPAAAELTPRAQDVGPYGVSTDGWGAIGFASAGARGEIRAKAPPGSTVISAFLHTATQGVALKPETVRLEGVAVEYAQSAPNTSTGGSLATSRADVAEIVATEIEAGSSEIHSFTIDEGRDGALRSGSDAIDGHALVALYDHPSLPVRSVAVLDGFLSSRGDKAAIAFDAPLATGAPGSFAETALGISFSTARQKSNVHVNGSLLTSFAGNCDDGVSDANGCLIAVGGLDDPLSPLNPSCEQDKERYNIAPLLGEGASEIVVEVNSPSNHHNIFLATFIVSADATVTNP